MSKLSESLIDLFYAITREGILSIDFDSECNSNISYPLNVISNLKDYEKDYNVIGLTEQFKVVSDMITGFIKSKEDILKEVEFFKDKCDEVYKFYVFLVDWLNNPYNTLDKYKEFKVYIVEKFAEFCKMFGEDYTLDNYILRI